MLLQGAVGVVHVSRMVLVVVDLHRLGVDVRLQRVERVWKRRKLICHGGYSPLFAGCDLDCETSLASLGCLIPDGSRPTLDLLGVAQVSAGPRREVVIELVYPRDSGRNVKVHHLLIAQ